MKKIETEIPNTNAGEIEQLINRIKSAEHNLKATDIELIERLLRTVIMLLSLVQRKNFTISNLRELIFGSKTEKQSEKVDIELGAGSEMPKETDEAIDKKSQGHGHRPLSEYTGARKVHCRNKDIEEGDRCTDSLCGGRLYNLNEPVVHLQFTGSPLVEATEYSREVLRCAKCQNRYKAPLPDGVSEEKYTASCDVTIALMKYGAGVPWHRQSQMQTSVGVPLSESVMWERCQSLADAALPVYIMLEKIASNGDVYYADDTSATILERERVKKYLGEKERKGTQTTGIIIEVGEQKISLYKCSHRHAGENMSELLALRNPTAPPPIQMSDALPANWKGEGERICAKCMVHARRQFYKIRELYPRQCKIALKAFSKIYKYEAETKTMSPSQRLSHHQKYSGPVMERLNKWIKTRLSKGKDEPNSPLGSAMRYFNTHYDDLSTFLRVPNAPIDNNEAERALKRFVLFRKNSLFFKTDHGADVGTLLMSLIESCRINNQNVWNYLLTLRSKAEDVRKSPSKFLPWNYTEAELE